LAGGGLGEFDFGKDRWLFLVGMVEVEPAGDEGAVGLRRHESMSTSTRGGQECPPHRRLRTWGRG
jgi:hypothetical protein